MDYEPYKTIPAVVESGETFDSEERHWSLALFNPDGSPFSGGEGGGGSGETKYIFGVDDGWEVGTGGQDMGETRTPTAVVTDNSVIIDFSSGQAFDVGEALEDLFSGFMVLFKLPLGTIEYFKIMDAQVVYSRADNSSILGVTQLTAYSGSLVASDFDFVIPSQNLGMFAPQGPAPTYTPGAMIDGREVEPVDGDTLLFYGTLVFNK